jgi:hypothetical protein
MDLYRRRYIQHICISIGLSFTGVAVRQKQMGDALVASVTFRLLSIHDRSESQGERQ